MSHVFGSRSTICQYKGVTRGSLHTNSGAEQLVILNTRNPLETHGPPLPFSLRLVLLSCPPSIPAPTVPPFHPISFPTRPGYNARQIDDSIEYQRIHCAARCNRWTKDQFKRIMEIDQTSWISCESEMLTIRSCVEDKVRDAKA